MMADDIENLRAIWDGKIPVCFTLSSDEVFTVEQPEPMFVSRNCNIRECKTMCVCFIEGVMFYPPIIAHRNRSNHLSSWY